MTEANFVPLMFQAQIPDRGKIQYAGDSKPASQWVDEWLKGCPPVLKQTDENAPVWKRRQPNPTVELPKFGKNIKTREYQICWRFVTNSGQDEGIIRPVIGAKGLPYFPGSSMKGAFLRACDTKEERDRYCGGETINERKEKSTVPGKLRFHGGYPVDMESWARRDRLVDVVHGQQPFQVMDSSAGHSANVQISLYRPRYKFGISSDAISNDDPEWERIWEIWERALAFGLGSRVSAGYGYTEEIAAQSSTVFSLHLKGKGLTPQLLNRTSEFRPNMFKATLRGHTLRILGGITNEASAKLLTHQIWGGIDGGAIVGSIGINFLVEEDDLTFGTHTYRPRGKPVDMPTFDLKKGRLDLLQVKPISPELKTFLRYLLQFTCLLGGFGKSWRRIHHDIFHKSYFERGDKPMIGCHWELLSKSQKLWVTAAKPDLSSITKFLNDVRQSAIAWLHSENQPDGYVEHWREVWHVNKVQVWGRIAKDKSDSKAVFWFHDEGILKNSDLAGKIGQIGRIWHRMYPRYVKDKSGKLICLKEQYIELLVIFPGRFSKNRRFTELLNEHFTLLWGGQE